MSDNQRFESNEHQFNQQDAHPTVYRTESDGSNYYYVGSDNTNSTGESNAKSSPTPSPAPKDKSKLVPLLAVFIAFAVLLSFGSGVLVMRYINNSRDKQVAVKQTAGNPSKLENSANENGDNDRNNASYLNKSFSLEKSAVRTDRENLSIAEIVEKNKRGVVAITTDKEFMTSFGPYMDPVSGSGFIISKDGYVVTNDHVVQGGRNIDVILENGDIKSAKLVGADPLNDVAVLKIDGDDYSFVDLGNSEDVVVGELAVAIGNPTGTLSGSVTAGIVSALERNINVQGLDMTLLQTDAAINSGNSGGALFNSLGEVIGINTAKLSTGGNSIYEGLGFAIPINTAKPIIESIIQHGYVKDRTMLGIAGRSTQHNFFLGDDNTGGLYIYEVMPNSAADKAGLRVGDIITEFDGKRVRTQMDINNRKKDKKPGDKVKVKYLRHREEFEVEVTLEAQDPPNERQ